MTLTAGDSQNCKHKKCRVSFFSVCFLHLLRQQSEGRNIKSNKAEQPKPVKILGLITTCTLKYQAGYHIVISASVSKYVVGYPKIYINLEIRKRKFRWIGHTLRNIKGRPTLESSRKQEERKTEKQLEKISNQGSGQKLE